MKFGSALMLFLCVSSFVVLSFGIGVAVGPENTQENLQEQEDRIEQLEQENAELKQSNARLEQQAATAEASLESQMVKAYTTDQFVTIYDNRPIERNTTFKSITTAQSGEVKSIVMVSCKPHYIGEVAHVLENKTASFNFVNGTLELYFERQSLNIMNDLDKSQKEQYYEKCDTHFNGTNTRDTEQ